ncbi:MAG: hypothetical protein WCK31_04225 [bacterium]
MKEVKLNQIWDGDKLNNLSQFIISESQKQSEERKLKNELLSIQFQMEEAAENMWLDPIQNLTSKMSFIQGAKWQAERMYSEEEILEILCKSHNVENTSIVANMLKKWFEQFKKK